MNNHHFQNAYRNLEQRMKALAEADGDVYLPNPEPSGPVDYIFICMEPSLAGWAKDKVEAEKKLASISTVLEWANDRRSVPLGVRYGCRDPIESVSNIDYSMRSI